MRDDTGLLYVQRKDTVSLVRSSARSSLISRGRKDAADLVLRSPDHASTQTVAKISDDKDADREFTFGVMYYEGQGIAKDYGKAAYWFERAANHGHAKAQWYLSTLLFSGKGVARDRKKSLEWCHEAAQRGNANAQFHLGWQFSVGQYVPQDLRLASFWYRKSADQGQTQAQMNLAAMYFNGQGLPLSYMEAHFWSLLAERLGVRGPRPPKAASSRDRASADLTPAQLSDIEKRVDLWIAQHGEMIPLP